MPTERRRPRRACADRAVDTRERRVVCAVVCRVTSPRLLLSSSHRRLGSVRADAGDAERAPSRERVVVPTERRRPRRACADRAVDTRARRVVCAVVCRVTSPRLLLSSSHRRLGSVRADAGDAERAPSRERVVVPTERRRPRRARADRAVDTRARRVVCAVVCRVTSPRLLLSSSHRRLGSVRADAGDAERAPSRERVVVPTERRRPRRACADRAADTRARRVVCAVVCRVTSPRLLLSSSHRRLGSVRADAGDAERAPSRERVVVPTERRRPRRACADRAADTRACRVVCAVVCRVTSPRLLLSSSHRRLGSVRADAGDAERAPSRERLVVPTERRRPRRACADRAVDTRARRVVCAVVCREAHHAHDAAARRPPWRSSLQNYGGPRPPLTGDRVCTGAYGDGGLRGRGLTGVGPTGSPYLRGIGGGTAVPVTPPPWVALALGGGRAGGVIGRHRLGCRLRALS